MHTLQVPIASRVYLGRSRITLGNGVFSLQKLIISNYNKWMDQWLKSCQQVVNNMLPSFSCYLFHKAQ